MDRAIVIDPAIATARPLVDSHKVTSKALRVLIERRRKTRLPTRAQSRGRRHSDLESQYDWKRLDGPALETIPDGELLAHLLAKTTSTKAPEDAADRLLHRLGSLADVVGAPLVQLGRISGLNTQDLITFRVIREVGARMAKAQLVGQPILKKIDDVVVYSRIRLAREGSDQIRILFLDKRSRLLADEHHQSGTLDHVSVYPREIFRRAFDLNASMIICIRSQVVGPVRLAASDRDAAAQLMQAGSTIGVTLGDYLVVGREGYVSYVKATQSGANAIPP